LSIASGGALLSVAGLGWRAAHRRRGWEVEARAEDAGSQPASDAAGWALCLALLALAVVKVGYIDGQTSLFRVASPAGTIPGVQNQAIANFEGKMMSLAYDLDRRQVRAGESIVMRMYWEPLSRPVPDLGSFLHLVPEVSKPPVAEAKSLYAVWVPTRFWRVGFYYKDDITLTIPAHIPPGQYSLVYGLYDPAESERRLIVSGTQPPRDYAVLDTVEVVP
jgi:hypothetical protein